MLDAEFPPGSHLEVGMVTKHPFGRLVKITGGAFWGTYGLSNHFYWREVIDDSGRLSDWEESGYGWDLRDPQPHGCPQRVVFKPIFP